MNFKTEDYVNCTYFGRFKTSNYNDLTVIYPFKWSHFCICKMRFNSHASIWQLIANRH